MFEDMPYVDRILQVRCLDSLSNYSCANYLWKFRSFAWIYSWFEKDENSTWRKIYSPNYYSYIDLQRRWLSGQGHRKMADRTSINGVFIINMWAKFFHLFFLVHPFWKFSTWILLLSQISSSRHYFYWIFCGNLESFVLYIKCLLNDGTSSEVFVFFCFVFLQIFFHCTKPFILFFCNQCCIRLLL